MHIVKTKSMLYYRNEYILMTVMEISYCLQNTIVTRVLINLYNK